MAVTLACIGGRAAYDLLHNGAFTSQRLALGLTLTLQTFLPLVIVALLLQRLQRRLQY